MLLKKEKKTKPKQKTHYKGGKKRWSIHPVLTQDLKELKKISWPSISVFPI